MYRNSHYAVIGLFLLSIILMAGCKHPPQQIQQNLDADNTLTELSGPLEATSTPTEEVDLVEGWAVLAEKDDYTDVGMTNMLVDYISNKILNETLINAGWEADHIHELQGFDRASLEAELDWLEMAADENDIVFFYVASHANHLLDIVMWEDFFKEEWAQISSQRRILMLDTCTARKFTDTVIEDPGSQLTIAAVDEDEFSWRGIEEEGLPIIGGVFTYYFTQAFSNLDADADSNGLVSVQEASDYAEKYQREYMHEVVWAVPEFIEPYHQMGLHPENDPSTPDVILRDTIYEPLYFDLAYYQ